MTVSNIIFPVEEQSKDLIKILLTDEIAPAVVTSSNVGMEAEPAHASIVL